MLYVDRLVLDHCFSLNPRTHLPIKVTAGWSWNKQSSGSCAWESKWGGSSKFHPRPELWAEVYLYPLQTDWDLSPEALVLISPKSVRGIYGHHILTVTVIYSRSINTFCIEINGWMDKWIVKQIEPHSRLHFWIWQLSVINVYALFCMCSLSVDARFQRLWCRSNREMVVGVTFLLHRPCAVI